MRRRTDARCNSSGHNIGDWQARRWSHLPRQRARQEKRAFFACLFITALVRPSASLCVFLVQSTCTRMTMLSGLSIAGHGLGGGLEFLGLLGCLSWPIDRGN